jgi:hypothetical protein
MKLKQQLALAEQRLPLPALAKSLGLYIPEKPTTCKSPLREDNNPSFSWWYSNNGRAYWKDHATNDHGDCAGFLAKAYGIPNHKAVALYLEMADVKNHPAPNPIKLIGDGTPKPIKPEMPKLPEDLHSGTCQEIADLLMSREWGGSIEALKEISCLGYLRFCTWSNQKAWVLIDSFKRFFEVRRLDAKHWNNGSKSDCRGFKHLLGTEQLQEGKLAVLIEGAPDFLAAFIYKYHGDRLGMTWAKSATPVSSFGAGLKISDEDLKKFKNIDVIIIPHLDEAGKKAASAWKDKLLSVGARVETLSLNGLVGVNEKDLADSLKRADKLREVLVRIEAKYRKMKGTL